MKIYTLLNIITCLFSLPCYSQASQVDSTFFSRNCDAKYLECDSLNIDNENIKYFLASKMLSYTDINKKKCYAGAIIIYVERRKYKKSKLLEIFETLSQKNNLAQFSAFNSCKAFELTRHAVLSRESQDYVEDHYLGDFDMRKRKK